MAPSLRSLRTVGVASLASLLLLTACGGDDSSSGGGGGGATTPVAADQLFDSDFEKVCDGVGQTLAAAYVPTPGAISPVVVLEQMDGFMSSRSSAVRAGWERLWVPENTMAMAELQLVGCLTRTNATRVQECTGYEIDDQVTDNVVHLNEATYSLTLREAATGVEVATTTFTALDDSCPMFVSFDAGETERDWYSFDDTAVQDFLAPYVAPTS
ncbi:MAG TPA: hypothetical protein DCR14_10740 [Acidimicrobiaceae bacterium]|nr:hypothetical protein [Acidimicrobiaceae bacterium]